MLTANQFQIVRKPKQKSKEMISMRNEKDNRVLGRTGARVVSEQELERVSGGIQTATAFCSFGPKGPDACPNS